MSKKVLAFLVFSLAILLFGAAAEGEDVNWKQTVPGPSEYGNKLYTRAHWVDFYFNETGIGVPKEADGWNHIGGMYCSVFDNPPDYKNGFTAVGESDIKAATVYGLAIKTYLDSWGFGRPPVKSGGWYLISPSYWMSKKGASGCNPLYGSADGKFNVKVRNSLYSGNVFPYYTIDNPLCLENPDSSGTFRAAGWHTIWRDQKEKRTWWAESPGAVRVAKEYAAKLGEASLAGSAYTTSAEFRVSYPYGVSVGDVVQTRTGKKVGDPEEWYATIINSTPYVAKDVMLRAYLLIKDSRPQLVAVSKADIAAADYFGNGWGTLIWNFKYPLPADDFTLLVTANVDCSEGFGSKSKPEPLKTVYAYGAWKNLEYGSKLEMGRLFPARGSAFQRQYDAYEDNYWTQKMTGGVFDGDKDRKDNPKQGGDYQNNLYVETIEVLDAETGNPVSEVLTNQNLKVRAKFKSTFGVSGEAWVRLWKYDGHDMFKFDVSTVRFEPKGEKEMTWNVGNIGEGKRYFVVSIDYLCVGNNPDDEDNWIKEKFDNKYEESTYEDNKLVAGINGADPPPWQPTPQIVRRTVYYPPLREVQIPVYDVVETPIIVWKEVPYYKAEKPKIRIRARLVR